MNEDAGYEHKGRIARARMQTTATPEQVWSALAEPDVLSAWFTDAARGELKPGETVTWVFDQMDFEAIYEVLAVVPGRRLVLAPPDLEELEGEVDPKILEALKAMYEGRPILEFEIESEGGMTTLTVVNSGFREGSAWEDEYEGVSSGWRMALAILEHYLENYYRRSRRTFYLSRKAEFSYDDLAPFYREPTAMSRWLTRSGEIGGPGDSFVLELRGGRTMSGKVLADTGREVCLSWDEIDGVLELKAFKLSGPVRMLCVRGCSWGQVGDQEVAAIESDLAEALERLRDAVTEGPSAEGDSRLEGEPGQPSSSSS